MQQSSRKPRPSWAVRSWVRSKSTPEGLNPKYIPAIMVAPLIAARLSRVEELWGFRSLGFQGCGVEGFCTGFSDLGPWVSFDLLETLWPKSEVQTFGSGLGAETRRGWPFFRTCSLPFVF